MHLMCIVDPESGKRTYTLKKVLESKVTKSAHPARFSPDDKYSRQRVTLKRRFGLLSVQKSAYLSALHRLLPLKRTVFTFLAATVLRQSAVEGSNMIDC